MLRSRVLTSLACAAVLSVGVVSLAGPAGADAGAAGADAGAAGAPAGAAGAPAVFAAGSTETVVAHIAGLDATLSTVPLAGLTPAAAVAAVTAAETALSRRVLALTAAPAHGKRTVAKVAAASLLARPGKVTLPNPATLTSPYSGRLRLVLNPKAVAALATRSAAAAAVSPVDASLKSGVAHPVLFDKGYDGAALDTPHLPATLIRALASGKGTLPEQVIPARYGAKTLDKAIVVNTSANKLVLYVKGRSVKTFVVATGQAGYPSPHGSFHVIAREAAPSWFNPHDPWSLSLPDVIGPGPDNPLGTRALQLDSPGILIHGIPEVENATLGQNASHGCVRMSRAEIEQLFPLIPVGTPVLMTS